MINRDAYLLVVVRIVSISEIVAAVMLAVPLLSRHTLVDLFFIPDPNKPNSELNLGSILFGSNYGRPFKITDGH